MNEDIKLAAKKGAYWLDTVYPEWTSAIDLERLDLSFPNACVIGQVFADHYRHQSGWTLLYNFLGADISEKNYGDWKDFIVEHGFEDEAQQYEELTEAWTELIEERRS